MARAAGKRRFDTTLCCNVGKREASAHFDIEQQQVVLRCGRIDVFVIVSTVRAPLSHCNLLHSVWCSNVTRWVNQNRRECKNISCAFCYLPVNLGGEGYHALIHVSRHDNMSACHMDLSVFILCVAKGFRGGLWSWRYVHQLKYVDLIVGDRTLACKWFFIGSFCTLGSCCRGVYSSYEAPYFVTLHRRVPANT